MAASDKPHVIRLRGPWQWGLRTPSADHDCPIIQTGESHFASYFQLPQGARGRFELRRRFNWPQKLGYRESLWVVVATAALPELWIELNSEPLGRIERTDRLPADWEISARVLPHNELRLIWDLDADRLPDHTSWVEVQLEVRLDVGPPA